MVLLLSSLDELKSLHDEKKASFDRKEKIQDSYDYLKRRTNEFFALRKEQQKELHKLQALIDAEKERLHAITQPIWEEYNLIKQTNDPKISALSAQASSVYRSMNEYRRQTRRHGKKSIAKFYQKRANKCQIQLQGINKEISKLAQETKKVKQRARLEDSLIDREYYNSLKNDITKLRRDLQNTQTQFNIFRVERNETKIDLQEAISEYLKAKNKLKDFKRNQIKNNVYNLYKNNPALQ